MQDQYISIEIHFLPCIAYFTLISQSKGVILLDTERYQKQTFRNRTRILGPNKVEEISVPVSGGSKALKPWIKDIKIDNSADWGRKNWKSIETAYRNAPFFEYYSHRFEKIFKDQHETLWHFDWLLLTECLDILKLKNKVLIASEIPEKTETIDVRSKIGPKTSQQTGWSLEAPSYLQVFGNDFAPNMSIIDLIFCLGPDATEYLGKSIFHLKTLKP